jgi:hypothetical protein
MAAALRWDGVRFGEVLKEEIPRVRLRIAMSLETTGHDVGRHHRRNPIIECNLLTAGMQCIADALRVSRLENEGVWAVVDSITVVYANPNNS